MSKYDKTLTTDRDKIRLMIGDTFDDDQMMEDEEIAFALSEWGNIYAAAAFCCDLLAARFARDVNYRFSTFWQDSGDAQEHYERLAASLREMGSNKNMMPLFTTSEFISETFPEIFYYEMHDNPYGQTTRESDTGES